MSEVLKVKIESVVDPNWINFALSRELFSWNICGYWARGAEYDDAVGWLLWESDGRAPRGAEPNRSRALARWRAGGSLPSFWHRLDRDACARAWAVGVRLWGEDWFAGANGNRCDAAIQRALLGEVKYG